MGKIVKLGKQIAEDKGLIPKEKLIKQFTDKRDLAKQFLDINPIYYDTAKNWWVWVHSDSKWKLIDEIYILNSMDDSAHNVNTINSREKNEIIESLKQEGRKRKPIDNDKMWVQFRDVILDLNTGETFNATSQYFITNPIPYKFGKTENTPTMDRLFEDWVGKDYVQTLYEILAYCCLPDYPIHRIFCFIGGGCNGKSQFLKLLRKFIGGENCCSTELDTLLNSRFEKTRLYKKLVCQMGETNFNEMSQTSLLKKLCGGDLIGFEYKNKDPFDAENYAKILIATNTLPTTTDKTLGFYRRWLIIDFPNRFGENGGDIIDIIPKKEYNNLAKKVAGILKKLLKNYQFHKEGTIEDRAEKYEKKSNPFDNFWKERVEEDFNSHIFKFEFKEEFNLWCKSHGFRKLSDQEIKHKMDEMNIDFGKRDYFGNNEEEGLTKRYRAWLCIKWKGDVQDVQDVHPPSLSISHRETKLNSTDILDIVSKPALIVNKNQTNIHNTSKKKETKTTNKTKIYELIPEKGETDLEQLFLGSQFTHDIKEGDFNNSIDQLKAEGLIVESKPGKIVRL